MNGAPVLCRIVVDKAGDFIIESVVFQNFAQDLFAGLPRADNQDSGFADMRRTVRIGHRARASRVKWADGHSGAAGQKEGKYSIGNENAAGVAHEPCGNYEDHGDQHGWQKACFGQKPKVANAGVAPHASVEATHKENGQFQRNDPEEQGGNLRRIKAF